MKKSILVMHARNQNPAAPVEVTVSGGEVLTLTVNKTAVKTYTQKDIIELLQAAGLDVSGLLMPFPEHLGSVAIGKIRFTLLPGEYGVAHVNNKIVLPEEAFLYTIVN